MNKATEEKTLLLVNTGSQKKRFILQRLKKLGIRIIALHVEKNWARPYVDDWILSNTADHATAIRDVLDYVEQHEAPDGVITFWEDDVLLTSRLSEELQCVGIPYESARSARNKYLFRSFCKEQNIPTPRFKLLQNDDDVTHASAEIPFPLVIKPAFGASSAFVVKVDDEKSLRETFRYIQQTMSTDIESSLRSGSDIFVEEYISGDEVDVDILLQHGKIKFWSISDNDHTQEPFFIEAGQTIPSRLPVDDQRQILDLAEEVLEKLGVRDGCIHFEAKLTPKGPVPIEANLRMGGDEVWSFVKAAWGVDLIERATQIAFGEYFKPIEKPVEPKKYLRGRYFLAEHSGVLSRLRVPSEMKKLPGFEEFHFFKKVGDAVFAPPEGYEYLGWLTAHGSNFLEAENNLEHAMRSVQFDISRFHSTSMIGKTTRRNQFSSASLNKRMVLGAAKIEHLRNTSIDDQRNLRIAIACNQYDGTDQLVEAELSTVGKNIQSTLEERGYSVSYLDFNRVHDIFSNARREDIDLVFNVCERINNSSLLEPHAASVLDILQIPYTGSNPFTLGLCIDKIRVKKLLTYHEIPTPRWDYTYEMGESIRDDLRFPLIVKPANTDNSLGITNESVVTNKQELSRQLEQVIVGHGRPAIIEEYIEGDEYDVSIFGCDDDDLQVLPLSRSMFNRMPDGYWHIYPFEAKFGDESVYKTSIDVQRPPKNINKRLASLISEIALDTYNILGCHDYGRVEIRVDSDNNPYVLELNPNPSINIGDCLPEVAKLVGLDYGDFLERIIKMAVRRYKSHPPYFHLQGRML